MTIIKITLFDAKRTDYVSSNGEPYSIHWKDKELDSFTVEYNTDNGNRAMAFAKRKIKAMRKTDERIKAWSIKVL